jgi:hypothetical protein
MSKEKKDNKLLANLTEREIFSSKEYVKTLADLKHQIQEARIKAITAVNESVENIP